MKPLSDPPKLYGLSSTNPDGKIQCNSVWIRGELFGLSLRHYLFVPLRVLRDLRGFTLRLLRRDFIADSRYSFFDVFPITESTEAKKSFAGGAKA